MSTDTFTTEETSRGTSGSLALLNRLFKHVPVMRWTLLPTLTMAALAAGGYQFFLWLTGRLADCESARNCQPIALLRGLFLSPSITVISLLAITILLLRAIQWNLFETGGQIGMRGLLKDMIHAVSRTRTTFFDEYPSGKIINRLVRDSDSLRVYAPQRLGDTINALVDLVVASVAIAFASPLAALLALPVFLFFLYVQRNIAPMLQHLMVLRSARFGEVLHRESDVIEGIRAFHLYNQLPSLSKRLTDSIYRFMQMHFLRGKIDAWGRLLCDSGVAVYGAGIIIVVHIAIARGTISTVLGVVIVTTSLRLGGTFAWLSWSLGQMFESAGHARRVFEYVDLPPEELEEGVTLPLQTIMQAPPSGPLSFASYTMSYRKETPVILRNLSVSIAPGSKVGLVGRTGAGKSSIVQSLFRMVYVHGGDITVGNTSLLSMDLTQARSLFAVVPQDPYLFEGTVRSNLDRLKEHTDEALSLALQSVRLQLSLDTQVSEGGANLSFGERQLLCLARVILSKRHFVIMDEPTSGVDTITDAVMQSVLRTALRDRTIITIAHRLETLTRMDRIIELQDGAIIRDGTPAQIIPLLTRDELAS